MGRPVFNYSNYLTLKDNKTIYLSSTKYETLQNNRMYVQFQSMTKGTGDSISAKQKGIEGGVDSTTFANLIASSNLINDSMDITRNINTGNAELPYKTEITLKDTYVLSKLALNNLVSNIGFTVRILVRNSKLNQIEYVNFDDLLMANNIIDTESMDYLKRTTQRLSTTSLYISNPTNIYGNQLVGDKIVIFTDSEVLSTSKLYIYGFLENDNYKYAMTSLSNMLDSNVYVSDGYNTLISSVGTRTQDYTISSFVIKNKSPLPTACVPQLFSIVFRNNYTNNIMTYPGPVDGYFIYDSKLIGDQMITLPSSMVASKFTLKSKDNNSNISLCVNISSIRGYVASVADINKFKLEYNITDIRGSINPDDVCPSIDKFIENQLSSELIIDAMDYQMKINDEKAKLQSNKDNLLQLLEQQDEINQLGKIIGKIKNVKETRDHQTNAINALQLYKQMNEYSKLKEVLDDRINLRKQNTLGFDINVNKTTTESFTDYKFALAPEDNYAINK